MTPQQHNCSVNKHIIELIVRIHDQNKSYMDEHRIPPIFCLILKMHCSE